VRPWLVWLIVVGSAVACTLSEIYLFKMVSPPDVQSALLGGLWIAMPFLLAAGLALLARRHRAALITLLVCSILSGVVGVYLLEAAAAERERSRQELATAVLPGEDPNRGAGGKRKAGAEIADTITSVFALFLAVVLPPIQVGAVAVPAGIAWAISAAVRANRAVDEGRTAVEHG
jgi:hypothetical protein